MSSGEWDLRALKALEEEEHKEFLALSQKNLFEPPSPPTRDRLLHQTQKLKLQQQQPKLEYAQLHPQTLKLPTINECNLILAARKRRLQQQDAPKSLTGRRHLKFTRALSFSANSLTTRSNGNRKKSVFSKIRGKTFQTSNSSSLSHLYNVSPFYTPPPLRRCETFHHIQPTRKIIKTYQQLEKQKLDSRREGQMIPKREVGKNESLWKYGANSTAASIIGQRKKLHSSSPEAESNTSDELGSEGTLNNVTNSDHSEPFPISYADCDDSATEAGSCTVPLTTDSAEMIRLMLSAATAAISTHPKSTSSAQYFSKEADCLLNERPLHIVSLMSTATTGGTAGRSMSNVALNSPPLSTAKINDDKSIRQTDYGSTHRTLSSRYPLELSASSFSPTEETVAYKAVREQQRNKSISYNGVRSKHTMRRGNSLTDETSANGSSSNYNSTKSNCPLPITRAGAKNVNFGKMYKTNSLDISTDLDNEEGKHIPRRSTFLKNPIVQGVKATSTELKTGVSAKARSTIDQIGIINANSMKNKSSKHIQHLLLHTTQESQLSRSSAFSREITSLSNNRNCIKMNILEESEKAKVSAFASLHQHFIDNELEQHIKHCSCSCNHMGYGNSMDYQTTDFSGLPDVTEHSNARRTLSRQNSLSNSDSGGDVAKIEKSKVNFCDGRPQPTTPHIANTKRKSKASHYAASHRCNRASRLKPRRGSWAIFLTFVATVCLFTIATMLAYQHFVVPNRHSHAQRLRIVRRILKEVPLVDGQNNFAWNVRKYAHNSLESVPMRRSPNTEGWIRPVWAQTDIERLKQGLVGVQMWSAYVPCEALGLDAVQVAIEQIDIIRRLTEMYSIDTELAKSSKDILTAQQHHKMASLIGIKGGHAIGSSLAVLRSFYSVGARALSLTHKCDLSWAGSSASESESGLSAFGKAVIREMNRLGMMVDLSYSSTATARDVLQVTRAPVIFSHSAARQLCNSTRNVPDDILRLVADNGGLIMVSFDSEDIACGEQAYLQDVVEHIGHIRTIAGIQHIGLGAGYDSIEVPPVGLEDVSKYPDLLATLLQDPNWSEQDIAMLAGKNFIRILETVENVRDYWKRADIQPIEQTEPQPKPHCSHLSS